MLTLLLLATGGAAVAKDAPGEGGAAISSQQVLTVHSDRYEVVLKSKQLRPGLKDTLDLYLSDFQTNAPITNVAISLGLRSNARELWTGSATATNRAGIFMVPFQAPADTGSFTVLMTIAGAIGEGRFALSGLQVSTERFETGASAPRGFRWIWLLGGALVLSVGLFVMARRHVSAAGAALILGVLLAPAIAQAHAGHDEAPASSGTPVGPGAQVFISKASQFLLGVRTEPLKRQPVQKRLGVLGRVAPRGGGEVEIVAPQAGRIFFADGRVPVIGLSVTRGEAVARLTVVDDLSLRVPLTGVITGVFVVNGQLVEAGQKLMTLLDPTVVWVHADVYEADVPGVQQSTRAVITSPGMPDLALTGRRVALGVTQGEVLGAIEAWFEVPNIGGRLKIGALVDVGIEQGGVESALVVSRSAVFEKDGRQLVFVHTAPERFIAREVTLGTSLGARVAVTGELNPGDRVVVAGGYPLLTAPVVGLGQ
ncbi:MAG: efflux RND transporter periplasmic adaptor subunit [Candidatus Eisenbacteria bacterium]|nr:efflux RND transporter periplasmic adaptor subunit [Candidatus Eisenbacteria bacterium]